ncbi:MAG: hypothetical protein CFE23_02965 [Flavobacterium sp. BFFFF1]|uniref:hypothetical protein n=2 Tax=unclassified Flavobacterium TaxID=196869 RepID=UPI000BD1E368|nr:hypothetical protein [Flavobacterium sp.]OYU81852.1 MAG: hypothetical protein CFE23_02965 [Flavobacterium sp. BFFFF1]
MTDKKQLIQDMEAGMAKIKALSSEAFMEVRAIYRPLFKRYIALEADDFPDPGAYEQFAGSLESRTAAMEFELKTLKNHDDDEVFDNYFQSRHTLKGFKTHVEFLLRAEGIQ